MNRRVDYHDFLPPNRLPRRALRRPKSLLTGSSFPSDPPLPPSPPLFPPLLPPPFPGVTGTTVGNVSVQLRVVLPPHQKVLTELLVVVIVVVMKAGLLLVGDGLPPLPGRLDVGAGLPPGRLLLDGARLMVLLGTTEAGREDGRTGAEAETEVDVSLAETGELDGRTEAGEELTGGTTPELEERSEAMTELKELGGALLALTEELAGGAMLEVADDKIELDDGLGQLTMAEGGFWNVVISLGRTFVQSVRPWMLATPRRERRR